MRSIPTSRGSLLRVLAAAGACMPLFAADGATPLTPDPVPQVVRVRMAETAKGGEVRDYAVTQQEGQTVYTAILVDPTTRERSLISVAPDGRLLSVLPVETQRKEAPPALPLDPAHIPDPPTRADGKDAAPATRRGRDDGTSP
jgi:hypothetical protein